MSIGPGISDANFEDMLDFMARVRCPQCLVLGRVRVDLSESRRQCDCGYELSEQEWQLACANAEAKRT